MSAAPNPGLIFDTINAYQHSAALKTAVELDLFTEIGRGHHTAEALAIASDASLRGVRILCDYLVIMGFLTKQGADYLLTPDSGMFLDKNSQAYLGSVTKFMLDPYLIQPYQHLTEIVRNGRTSLPEEGTVSHDNPIWVEFAHAMMPMMYPAAVEIAELVAGTDEIKVLDLAAGHGIFGVMMAKQNSKAHVTALDWANVLTVAAENAARFGVADRHKVLPGSAFDTEFGALYDVILVTNFFHHFDPPTCENLMRKILASLKPGGRCVTLEFVPNEDRVTPPTAAAFSMMMLGTTASGDAYTFAEYKHMFSNAGFATIEFHSLHRSPESVILSAKA